jgi:hypothetical protein
MYSLSFQFVRIVSLPCSIRQLNQPAVQRQASCHDIERRARRLRYYATRIAGQRIDQAALADIRRACDHHAPGLRQVLTEPGVPRKSHKSIRCRRRLSSRQRLPDILERSSERSSLLIEENPGCPRRRCLS